MTSNILKNELFNVFVVTDDKNIMFLLYINVMKTRNNTKDDKINTKQHNKHNKNITQIMTTIKYFFSHFKGNLKGREGKGLILPHVLSLLRDIKKIKKRDVELPWVKARQTCG